MLMTRRMDGGNLNGKVETPWRVSMLMMKDVVTARCSGLMAASIKACGRMEFNRDWD